MPDGDYVLIPLATAVVREIIPSSDAARLQEVKDKLAYWFRIGEAAYFQVVDLVNQISQEQLFRFDLNPDSGQPYRSMSEYYPYLLREMKSTFHLHKLSERLVREALRVDKVFVQGAGISRQQILEEGISRYTELAEALDYDIKTGEIRETPRAGKLGKDEGLQILQESREGGWSLESFREELDTRRGVQRRGVRIDWLPEYEGKHGQMYSVGRIVVFDGADSFDSTDEGLTLELARYITRRLGATSNLPQEEKE